MWKLRVISWEGQTETCSCRNAGQGDAHCRLTIYIYICRYADGLYVCIYIYIYMLYVCIYIYIYMCIHAYIYIYIYIRRDIIVCVCISITQQDPPPSQGAPGAVGAITSSYHIPITDEILKAKQSKQKRGVVEVPRL